LYESNSKGVLQVERLFIPRYADFYQLSTQQMHFITLMHAADHCMKMPDIFLYSVWEVR